MGGLISPDGFLRNLSAGTDHTEQSSTNVLDRKAAEEEAAKRNEIIDGSIASQAATLAYTLSNDGDEETAQLLNALSQIYSGDVSKNFHDLDIAYKDGLKKNSIQSLRLALQEYRDKHGANRDSFFGTIFNTAHDVLNDWFPNLVDGHRDHDVLEARYSIEQLLELEQKGDLYGKYDMLKRDALSAKETMIVKVNSFKLLEGAWTLGNRGREDVLNVMLGSGNYGEIIRNFAHDSDFRTFSNDAMEWGSWERRSHNTDVLHQFQRLSDQTSGEFSLGELISKAGYIDRDASLSAEAKEQALQESVEQIVTTLADQAISRARESGSTIEMEHWVKSLNKGEKQYLRNYLTANRGTFAVNGLGAYSDALLFAAQGDEVGAKGAGIYGMIHDVKTKDDGERAVAALREVMMMTNEESRIFLLRFYDHYSNDAKRHQLLGLSMQERIDKFQVTDSQDIRREMIALSENGALMRDYMGHSHISDAAKTLIVNPLIRNGNMGLSGHLYFAIHVMEGQKHEVSEVIQRHLFGHSQAEITLACKEYYKVVKGNSIPGDNISAYQDEVRDFLKEEIRDRVEGGNFFSRAITTSRYIDNVLMVLDSDMAPDSIATQFEILSQQAEDAHSAFGIVSKWSGIFGNTTEMMDSRLKIQLSNLEGVIRESIDLTARAWGQDLVRRESTISNSKRAREVSTLVKDILTTNTRKGRKKVAHKVVEQVLNSHYFGQETAKSLVRLMAAGSQLGQNHLDELVDHIQTTKGEERSDAAKKLEKKLSAISGKVINGYYNRSAEKKKQGFDKAQFRQLNQLRENLDRSGVMMLDSDLTRELAYQNYRARYFIDATRSSIEVMHKSLDSVYETVSNVFVYSALAVSVCASWGLSAPVLAAFLGVRFLNAGIRSLIFSKRLLQIGLSALSAKNSFNEFNEGNYVQGGAWAAASIALLPYVGKYAGKFAGRLGMGVLNKIPYVSTGVHHMGSHILSGTGGLAANSRVLGRNVAHFSQGVGRKISQSAFWQYRPVKASLYLLNGGAPRIVIGDVGINLAIDADASWGLICGRTAIDVTGNAFAGLIVKGGLKSASSLGSHMPRWHISGPSSGMAWYGRKALGGGIFIGGTSYGYHWFQETRNERPDWDGIGDYVLPTATFLGGLMGMAFLRRGAGGFLSWLWKHGKSGVQVQPGALIEAGFGGASNSALYNVSEGNPGFYNLSDALSMELQEASVMAFLLTIVQKRATGFVNTREQMENTSRKMQELKRAEYKVKQPPEPWIKEDEGLLRNTGRVISGVHGKLKQGYEFAAQLPGQVLLASGYRDSKWIYFFDRFFRRMEDLGMDVGNWQEQLRKSVELRMQDQSDIRQSDLSKKEKAKKLSKLEKKLDRDIDVFIEIDQILRKVPRPMRREIMEEIDRMDPVAIGGLLYDPSLMRNHINLLILRLGTSEGTSVLIDIEIERIRRNYPNLSSDQISRIRHELSQLTERELGWCLTHRADSDRRLRFKVGDLPAVDVDERFARVDASIRELEANAEMARSAGLNVRLQADSYKIRAEQSESSYLEAKKAAEGELLRAEASRKAAEDAEKESAAARALVEALSEKVRLAESQVYEMESRASEARRTESMAAKAVEEARIAESNAAQARMRATGLVESAQEARKAAVEKAQQASASARKSEEEVEAKRTIAREIKEEVRAAEERAKEREQVAIDMASEAQRIEIKAREAAANARAAEQRSKADRERAESLLAEALESENQLKDLVERIGAYRNLRDFVPHMNPLQFRQYLDNPGGLNPSAIEAGFLGDGFPESRLVESLDREAQNHRGEEHSSRDTIGELSLPEGDSNQPVQQQPDSQEAVDRNRDMVDVLNSHHRAPEVGDPYSELGSNVEDGKFKPVMGPDETLSHNVHPSILEPNTRTENSDVDGGSRDRS